ncbi:uncharacterized protein LOC112566878 [Pomacea canaliculata]|uniref:uncharacterized protein LOC112566878 n=1 Tax=Pomacea canaliculata TaxID=400727 RepID=UPI000D72A069|nr:uncharacterized protein LOC112566878 [Pomacea canaliculata]
MANHAAVQQEARELRDIIRKIITELDEHHRNVNIATATGSAASFLGGVMTVASAILAIPTGGLTLPLAGAGAILAGAGGTVSVGATLVEFIINKHNVSDVQRRWERFQTDLAGYYAEIYRCEEVPAKILNIVGDIINGVIEVRQGYQLIKGSMAAARALKVGGVGGRIAAGASQVGNMIEAGAVGGVAGLGAKAVGRAFFFLNVVLIPISLVELVRSASAANRGERSKASSSLERLADFLDRVANNQL